MTIRRITAQLITLVMVGALLATVAPAAATVPDDNGEIAFIRAGGLPEAWVMGEDGTGQRRLPGLNRASSLAWAPDGERLAVEADIGFVVISADGSIVDVLAGAAGGSNPAWHPDRDDIAFERDGDLWSIGLVGDAWRLTDTPGVVEREPAFSAFARLAYVRDGDIWVMDPLEDLPDMNLTRTVDVLESEPSWSPDGRRIAYRGVVDFDEQNAGQRTVDVVGNADVWVMDADGRNPVNLTQTEVAWEGDPAWSPDGSRIAFTRDPDPNAHGDIWFQSIWTMNPDGTGQVERTDEADGDRDPSWQPLPGTHRIGMVDPATGLWYLRSQGRVESFYYGDPGDAPMLGDWDCDGEASPGLYRQSDGYVYLRNSNSQGIADIRFFFGDPGDIPLAGDFDGDGCDTVSVYRPTEGQVFIHNELGSGDQGLGAAEISYYFGDPGDKPFAGDFNGDGIDTVGLHRESTGLVYFRNSHTQGNADADFVFGDPGDRFVAGDWTEDGIDTPGLFRPSDETWYFRNSNTQGNADATIAFGEADWLPVAGQFELEPELVPWLVANFVTPPDPAECDEVVPVARLVEVPDLIPRFFPLVTGAFTELLAGLTAAEEAAGLASWFSDATAGSLIDVSGEATGWVVDLEDLRPIIPSAGTSCGGAALNAQLEETAVQFQRFLSDCVRFAFEGDVDAYYDFTMQEPRECDP